MQWSEVERWSPGTFLEFGWQWPSDVIRPLSDALRRRVEVVDRTDHELGSLVFGSLHFDGEISVRDMSARSGVRGRLFFAHRDDVVYSKIDARNGAISVLSAEFPRLVFSSEYPIYSVDSEIAEPGYVKLLFRMPSFRARINSLVSGASGRKRVEPAVLEDIAVPLPTLVIQRGIVAHWEEMQAEIVAVRRSADELEADASRGFLEALGFSERTEIHQPRVFAVRWSQVDAWGCASTYRHCSRVDLKEGRYPAVRGRACLTAVQHGCSASPSDQPTSLEVLRISAATRGAYDRNQRKFIADDPEFRRNFGLKAGDILMCRTNGTLAYVGMSAIIPDDESDLIFPDKLIRVRTADAMEPLFLWHLLQSSPLRSQIESAARTAVGNFAIGGNDIWNFRFPLPPLDVQQRLAEQITLARKRAADERAAATRLADETAREVEEMILGHREVVPAMGESDR